MASVPRVRGGFYFSLIPSCMRPWRPQTTPQWKCPGDIGVRLLEFLQRGHSFQEICGRAEEVCHLLSVPSSV